MIEMIMPFVKDHPAREFPHYNTFLNDQKNFISYRYSIFRKAEGYESNGIRLLRYILSFSDFEYLDQQRSNLDRYMNHIRFIRRDLMNIFDRVQRGRGYFNLFFKKSSKGATEEFLFPIEDVNSIVNLPITSDHWLSWRYVRPLRLWTHNSTEFTTNIINDQIRFNLIPPTYSVLLLDVVALVLKYYMWYTQCRTSEDNQELAIHTPQQFFLHKYVMCDLIWDLANVWLLNQINEVLDVEERDDLGKFNSFSLQAETQYGRIAASSKKGFTYIWDRFVHLQGQLRPESIMSSNLLYGGSLFDRIRLVDSTLTLPINRRYEYLRWLRDKDLFFLFLKFWSHSTHKATYENILRYLRRRFFYMLNRRPWNNCTDLVLKNEVQRQMEAAADLVL